MAEYVLKDYRSWIEQQEMPAGRRKILLSALELFARDGYDGTATAQIAKNAGMSQATLFKYFPTKQDLLIQVVAPIIDNLIMGYQTVLVQNVSDHGISVEEMVGFILRDRWTFLKNNRDFVLIILNAVLTNSEIRSRVQSVFKNASAQRVGDVVTTLRRDHKLDSQIDLVSMVRTIVGQLFSYFIQTQVLFPDGDFDEEKDLKLINHLIVKALS